MRLIQEIPDENYKISVFSWNNKYIIKIEDGLYEQTYKINEWDLTSEDEVTQITKHLLVNGIKDVFSQMNKNLNLALDLV
jgi:hypothetical protein